MANNEASDLVEMALNEAITKLDDYKEGDLLEEWVVVAFVTNPNEELGHSYPQLYSNGTLPTYRAIGLLTIGLKGLTEDLTEGGRED